MVVVIKKTSDDNFVDFKDFNTFAELINFKDENECGLVISKNYDYGDDPQDIVKYRRLTLEQAKMLVSCEYEIEIYDDYRE